MCSVIFKDLLFFFFFFNLYGLLNENENENVLLKRNLGCLELIFITVSLPGSFLLNTFLRGLSKLWKIDTHKKINQYIMLFLLKCFSLEINRLIVISEKKRTDQALNQSFKKFSFVDLNTLQSVGRNSLGHYFIMAVVILTTIDEKKGFH